MAGPAQLNAALVQQLQGIAQAALNQTPADMDTFQDAQNFALMMSNWPAYTVAAGPLASGGPLLFPNEAVQCNLGQTGCGSGIAALIIDTVTAAVKQTGVNPKSLGA